MTLLVRKLYLRYKQVYCSGFVWSTNTIPRQQWHCLWESCIYVTNKSTVMALSCQQTRFHDNNDTACEKEEYICSSGYNKRISLDRYLNENWLEFMQQVGKTIDCTIIIISYQFLNVNNRNYHIRRRRSCKKQETQNRIDRLSGKKQNVRACYKVVATLWQCCVNRKEKKQVGR